MSIFQSLIINVKIYHIIYLEDNGFRDKYFYITSIIHNLYYTNIDIKFKYKNKS